MRACVLALMRARMRPVCLANAAAVRVSSAVMSVLAVEATVIGYFYYVCACVYTHSFPNTRLTNQSADQLLERCRASL